MSEHTDRVKREIDVIVPSANLAVKALRMNFPMLPAPTTAKSLYPDILSNDKINYTSRSLVCLGIIKKCLVQKGNVDHDYFISHRPNIAKAYYDTEGTMSDNRSTCIDSILIIYLSRFGEDEDS